MYIYIVHRLFETTCYEYNVLLSEYDSSIMLHPLCNWKGKTLLHGTSTYILKTTIKIPILKFSFAYRCIYVYYNMCV